jgi:hypothetical protein
LTPSGLIAAPELMHEIPREEKRRKEKKRVRRRTFIKVKNY